ncbi:MAG: DUF5682 family protein [Phormidium sp.]
MPTRIFGIRHHGPGSAQSLHQALHRWQPQQILIEGPPEAATVTHLAADRDLQPPVALLIYSPEQPQTSVYYPFTLFSPEWQALQYAVEARIPIHWLDLPQCYQFALEEQQRQTQEPKPTNPIQELAEAAGAVDGDRWWEQLIEQGQPSEEQFTAILEAMTALRETAVIALGDRLREAAMQRRLRQVQQESPHDRLAVVCGAWHSPALAEMPSDAEIATQLESLSQLCSEPLPEVQATWIPWSYRQLAAGSGYKAGMTAPGWYHYLWETRHQPPQQRALGWLTQVAGHLRELGQLTSTAEIIDAVRLANTLAALRDRPGPGLEDLQDATQAVMLPESTSLGSQLRDRLEISDRLGQVPHNTPTAPLQQDLQQQAQQLHLKISSDLTVLDLDLRRPRDNQRSQLFHRLELLGISWASLQGHPGLGTFRELWHLQWQPSLDLELIQRCIWGSSLETAANAYSQSQAEAIEHLPPLAALVDRLFRANLPQAISGIRPRLETVASQTHDLNQLAAALPPLVGILRYRNLQQTDVRVIQPICDRLILRCCLNLRAACRHLNPAAARQRAEAILTAHGAIAQLPDCPHPSRWLNSLETLLNAPDSASLLAGLSCRLLLDAQYLSRDRVSQHLGWVLHQRDHLDDTAHWLEGFLQGSSLQGSGLLLVHDDRLLGLIDHWVRSLPEDRFLTVLPLLHRSFAPFSPAERRQIGMKVLSDVPGLDIKADPPQQPSKTSLDPHRSRAVLPILRQILAKKGRP